MCLDHGPVPGRDIRWSVAALGGELLAGAIELATLVRGKQVGLVLDATGG